MCGRGAASVLGGVVSIGRASVGTGKADGVASGVGVDLTDNCLEAVGCLWLRMKTAPAPALSTTNKRTALNALLPDSTYAQLTTGRAA